MLLPVVNDQGKAVHKVLCKLCNPEVPIQLNHPGSTRDFLSHVARKHLQHVPQEFKEEAKKLVQMKGNTKGVQATGSSGVSGSSTRGQSSITRWLVEVAAGQGATATPDRSGDPG